MLEGRIALSTVVEMIELDIRKLNAFIEDMNRTKTIGIEDKVFMYARKHMHLSGELGLAYRLGLDIVLDYEERPCCLGRIDRIRYKRMDDDEWEVYDLA